MRVASLALVMSLVAVLPTSVQAQPDTWEFGIGPHVVFRDDSTTHSGGGITLARRYGTFAAVFDGGVTRRDGHNDWRLVGGPRASVRTEAGPVVFVQALAGTLIRQRDAGWAVMPGLGVDLPWPPWSAVRVQIDAPVERSEARTAKSARASIWLTFH